MDIDYQNLEYIDRKLRSLMTWIEARYGIKFTITSQLRQNDPGVHGTLPLRGHDLRCWDTALGELICAQVNEHWEYDPERTHKVCAMYHDAGSGSHIHLQVHPNTREK
jgi:hypothetical protein